MSNAPARSTSNIQTAAMGHSNHLIDWRRQIAVVEAKGRGWSNNKWSKSCVIPNI
ncbi:hypothetical protein TOL_1333 [Thalassolituus oleivorans MIL-1]|jgi:hypothetical protein|uniref:Uncharacterized protein n=1 Tax=Thalassolituus oleivorans MIL-1 TaxID=1298593 RepID=M5DQH0_9GAMM|nr:hypothetical protein TOL_1333 [Thalassolituus oleivorans MIL-1]